MKLFKRAGLGLILSIAIAASAAFADVNSFVEAGRVHSAVGAFGCTVSGASVTTVTASVITCAAAHNLISGDQVQTTGIVGTTTDNVLAYVTVLSPTTFAIYSDPAQTLYIIGTGSYSSGGVVSMAYDVSGATNGFVAAGDVTLKVKSENMTANADALVYVQESADGFVSDIREIAVFHVGCSTCGSTPVGGISSSWRKYQLGAARFGVTSVRLRLYVGAITGSSSVALSLVIGQ